VSASSKDRSVFCRWRIFSLAGAMALSWKLSGRQAAGAIGVGYVPLLLLAAGIGGAHTGQ
jgi:hypothetical protein